MTKG
jgi:hypothetical protein